MSNYEVEPTEDAGFGEISYDFAAATTPLSDLNAGEPGFGDNVSVHLDDDEDDDEDYSDDDDYEEDEQDEQVQADGTVIVTIQPDGGDKKKSKKKKSKKKKSKKKDKPVTATQAAIKLGTFAVSAMATAAVSSGNAHAPGEIETGQWSAGLFSCFDFCVPNCFMATFCPCISAAQIASRIGFKYSNALIMFGFAVLVNLVTYVLMFVTLTNTEDYYYKYYGYYYTYSYSTTKLTAWGYVSFAITLLIFSSFWYLRTKVRERFQLPGSIPEDFCIAYLCSLCSLAQMATHVKSYKPGSCDFGQPDELQPYIE